MDTYRVIEVKQSIFADNDRDADRLRQQMKEEKTFLINLMSSPGSGKTTTLTKLIAALKDDLRIGVMEADIDSDVDADTISRTGVKVIQLHTGGMCHLDADMTRQGVKQLDTENLDLVILENVGILCVFPIFHTVRLGQKIRRSPQLPPKRCCLKLWRTGTVFLQACIFPAFIV